MSAADTLRPCAIDCDCAATPRALCPACRRYPCADLLDTCGLCALASANGVPTVRMPPVDRVAAWRRLRDEARAAAEREHAAWSVLTPAEREAETRLSVRRAT